MVAAMREAIATASQFSIGWCSVRNITHAGAIGYYALAAAREGQVGIATTASIPLMAYHGSRVPGVSTNPIAIAVPTNHDPILLDMSTSTAALGKIMAARDAGRDIPDDWGIDADGRPTTDPAKVATLTPLGGPKGSALSLMIEILASVLVANPVIAPALAKDGAAAMNGMALALKIDAFGPPDRFRAEVERLADALKALPRADGNAAILMPGERGFATAAQRQIDGIPLPAGTARRLAQLAAELGVDPPAG
jgi:ureidoglycolate dehydrogenase (NAD+)